MKVLLYTEGLEYISKSGVGRAIKHQMEALKLAGVEYTLDVNDDYDIVHINTYGMKSYLLAKEAKKKGKKVVYHAHSTEEDFRNSFVFSNQLSGMFKKWLIKCYRLGDCLVTPTPYSKRLLEGYNINRPIYAVSNGIDLKFFKRDDALGQEFRKKYGFKKNDKVIMAIGLLIERKGIIDFVELASRLPQYKFIWFGDTPSYLIPPKIKKAMKAKNDNLIFAGYVPREVIRSAFSGSDLYLFPTHEETEGIVLLESLALKQKALISDIPVFEDWVEDGKNVYKAKNIDDFKCKIVDILEGKLPDLTKAGYEVAKARDLKYIGKQLKEIYEGLLNNKE
ncbi:MAG: glycosyltransferase family 4 protein [Bacilli bacterium]|nr:glycosyltransferase family 4 protein [Bacilli bacterium]MDD4644279.1 glycosyltransferase family 4 protein [Bacilli bacterium]